MTPTPQGSQDWEVPKGFHQRNHLFFRREVDGSVTVQKWTATKPFTQVFFQNIPSNEWASIVASVSREGETGETFRAALDKQVQVSEHGATDSEAKHD